jgi:predicted pyridoxine 5'-phosphate oxidase superfamily flavin-nucleotide-binding protein
MARKYLELTLTPAVKRAQQRYYGRSQRCSTQLEDSAPARTPMGPDEIAFNTARDSCYLPTVSETGWPYIQHRGGPAGFLRVLDPHTLAFADQPGNRQLLSTGNVTAGNDRIALFLMDYPRRERLKIMGHASIKAMSQYPGLIGSDAAERVFVIDVVAYDWNCPRYITPRYTAAEVDAAIAPLQARIAELEAQLAAAQS